jgi:ATP-dependent DNA ligase
MARVATTRPRAMSRFLARVLHGAKPSPFPGFIKPCLATQRDEVTSARGFVHELKLDGYRIQTHLRDGHFPRLPPSCRACRRASSSSTAN